MAQSPRLAPTSTPASPPQSHTPLLPTSQSPSPSSNPSILLIAKWSDYAMWSRKKVGSKKSHVYTLLAYPESPLQAGMQVRLVARNWRVKKKKKSTTHIEETYEAHVVGSVTGINAREDGRACAVIVNECARSCIGVVQLIVPLDKAVVEIAQVEKGAIVRKAKPKSPSLLATSSNFKLPHINERCRGAQCAESQHEIWDRRAVVVEADWESNGEEYTDDEGKDSSDVEPGSWRKRARPDEDPKPKQKRPRSNMYSCGWSSRFPLKE